MDCNILAPLCFAFDSLAPQANFALSGLIERREPDFFNRVRKKGSRRDRSGIDSFQAHNELEPGTLRRYKDAVSVA